MEVSHVIRGVEHLPNTQIHMQLQEALGFPTPIYAHLPIILGQDKTKLSKRHGAVAVTDYAEQGYLPETMFNFLALLGWSPGDEREILERQEIIDLFSLESCSKAPAVFDLGKAEWMNAEYMKITPLDRLISFVLPRLQRAGLFEEDPSPERVEWLGQVIDLMRERARLLDVFETWAKYFFTDQYDFEDRAREKWLGNPETADTLRPLAEKLSALEDWTAEALEAAVRSLAEELGVKAGNVIHPCRAAVSGTTVGPSLFHMLEILPRDTVVSRIQRVAEMVARGELAAPGDGEG
jgi:glutamyl-tRNA synthetase